MADEKSRRFRAVQAFLLLLLVLTFAIYCIALMADIVAFRHQTAFLFSTLLLDVLALTVLAIGVRGVALEVFHLVLAFAVVSAVVSLGQAFTLAFRWPFFTTISLLLDLALTGLGAGFARMLYA